MIRPIAFTATVTLFSLVACVKIAGLEEVAHDNNNAASSSSGQPPPSLQDAGSLPNTPEGVEIKPEKLELTSTCNNASEAKPLAITNNTREPLAFTVEAPEGSGIMLEDDKGTPPSRTMTGSIAPTETATIRAKVTLNQATGSLAQLSVTTAGRTLAIPTQVTVTGGALKLTPNPLNFGEIRRDTTSDPQNVEIENTGNEDVNIASWTSSGTDFTVPSGSIPLKPGEKKPIAVTFTSGGAGNALTQTLTPVTVASLCGDKPVLTVQGKRVDTFAPVSPTTADFGEVVCNTSSIATTKPIKISNYHEHSDVTYQVELPTDSWFTATPTSGEIQDVELGTVNSATVNIGLKPVAATLGDHVETIKVHTTLLGATETKDVTAKLRVVGAILEINPTSRTGFVQNETKSVTLRNVGNKFVYLRHSSTNNLFELPYKETPLDPQGGFASVLALDIKFVGTGSQSGEIRTERISTPFSPIPLFPASGTLCNVPPVVTVSSN